MSTIIEIRVPTDGLPLRDTFEHVPSAEFELARAVAHGDDRFAPLVWATAQRPDALEKALSTDPSVEDLDCLTDRGRERLYRVCWTDRTTSVISTMLERDATLLDAYGTADGWQCRVLFPSREMLSESYTSCTDDDLALEIENIHELDRAPDHDWLGLTGKQRDALAAALEYGYYDVPRTMTMANLAAELDISHQALSERLRRGHKNLVVNALAHGHRDGTTLTHSPSAFRTDSSFGLEPAIQD